VPAPERAPRPAARPPLRLVDDARLRAADRRRRARLVAVVGSILAAGIFFLLAAFNAMLVTGQSRIDDLQKRVQQAQAEYSANRLQVAELEAPGHIADVAKNKLGMVPPSRTTYLTPSRAMAAQVQHGQDATASASADGGTPWADVKPYLGPTP
jgi:cell division protein FtsB